MPPKRKRSSVVTTPEVNSSSTSILPLNQPTLVKPPARPSRQSSRRGKPDTNPEHNADILDSKTALRASPDADEAGESFDLKKIEVPIMPGKENSVNVSVKDEESDSPLSEIGNQLLVPTPAKKQKKAPTKKQAAKKAAEKKIKKEDDEDEWDKRVDPDGDGDDEGQAEDADAIKLEARRPPPINSDYLPLPWKGRLGYACLNTYLRSSNPPVFTSSNLPHAEYGYKLAPFAGEALAEVGKVVAELGHRVSTHPGQVLRVQKSLRMQFETSNIMTKCSVSLKLPTQIDKDAVLILHMGATLPPCANDMDLMIEAKDKEQAVFELMRTFKLPGYDTFNDIVPYERDDDNRVLPKKPKKKKTKKQVADEIEEFGHEIVEEEEPAKEIVPEGEVGMGGKDNRVYWPVGMEEWLRPKKREIKKKGTEGDKEEEEIFKNPTPANFEARKKISARKNMQFDEEVKEKLAKAECLNDVSEVVELVKSAQAKLDEKAEANGFARGPGGSSNKKSMPAKKKVTPALAKKKTAKKAQTPSASVSNEDEDEDEDYLSMPDLSADDDDELKETSNKGC
ncbi:hypothetical protein DID88_003780 [Monilinia fructigena]|uniref:Uncharacterized protein n=1 Tax=Monilinia fructigena TaxID=38457 RepID=A0A395ITH7_9HELO|nr:hypothetical protein DID88_003780 [Monilinia fructigena]